LKLGRPLLSHYRPVESNNQTAVKYQVMKKQYVRATREVVNCRAGKGERRATQGILRERPR
jgi:hypothetical protein